jgi:hypothetical protein
MEIDNIKEALKLKTNKELDFRIEELAGMVLPSSLKSNGTNKLQKVDLFLWLNDIINGGE